MLNGDVEILFEKVGPYQFYMPIQDLLDRMRPESQKKWQQDFYERLILSSVFTFFEDDLDFSTSPQSMTYDKFERLEKFIVGMAQDLPSFNNMISTSNLDRLVAGAYLDEYKTHEEIAQMRKELVTLIKLGAGYAAIFTLNGTDCPIEDEKKQELVRYFKTSMDLIYKECISLEKQRQKAEEEREQQKAFNEYHSRWDRKLEKRLNRYGQTLNSLDRLSFWDKNIFHFIKNLAWAAQIVLKFTLLKFTHILFVYPFKAFSAVLLFLFRKLSDTKKQKIENALARVYLALGPLVPMAWLWLMSSFTAFCMTGKFLPIMGSGPAVLGLLPITFSAFLTGIICVTTALGLFYFTKAILSRARNVLKDALYHNVVWENNMDIEIEVLQRDRNEHEHINVLVDKLHAPIHIPLEDQIILTKEDVMRIKQEAILDRLEIPAFDNELFEDFNNMRSYYNMASRIAGVSRASCPTFVAYKRQLAEKLSEQVSVDESLVSEPRLR